MTQFLVNPEIQIVEANGKLTRDGFRLLRDLQSGASPFNLPAILAEYTVATAPTAANFDNGVIIVSDESGGRTLATSDGTNWRRVSDGAVIS